MSTKKTTKRLEQLPNLRKEKTYLSKQKNYKALDRVIKEIDELETYINSIEHKNAYAHKLAKQAYIDENTSVFVLDSDAKMKQRYIKQPPLSSLYDVYKINLAKQKLLPIFEEQKTIKSKKLNLSIKATHEQIEAYILELDDSFTRIALRYYLIDKKSNAQINQIIGNSSTLKKINAYLKEQ